MVRVAGAGDRLVAQVRHAAEPVRVAVVRGDTVEGDSAPRQVHAGCPLLQVPLSPGTGTGVRQVPRGDAEVRTLCLEVPAHGALVVLHAAEEFPVVMATGPEAELRLGPREGEQARQEAVLTGALLVEQTRPDTQHLQRDQRPDQLHRYLGQLPVVGEIETGEPGERGGVGRQGPEGVEVPQVQVVQLGETQQSRGGDQLEVWHVG